MKKHDLKMLVVTSVMCLLPIILSAILYPKLPAQLVVHWDSHGIPNGYMNKTLAAFGLPWFFCLMNMISHICLANGTKGSGHPRAMLILGKWLIPILSLVIMPVTLFYSLGVQIPITAGTSIVVGIIIMICGNYLPKSRQNNTIGIRIPWTLSDRENWNKTHRMAGPLWIIGGLLMIAETFVTLDHPNYHIPFLLIVVGILTVVPTIYSYLLYRKSSQ